MRVRVVFVFVTVCLMSVSGRGRRVGVVVVGGSVCCVCRSLDSNLTADSLRSVPQDKNGARQLHQVKRMIGGLGNVLFAIYSQTLNGKDPRVSFGEPVGPSENSSWAFLG